jgi:hypothetical protein
MASGAKVAASIDELLVGVTSREPIVADDGKSGNWLERVVIGDETYVVKHCSLEADWISRVIGDRVFWPLILWRGGLFDQLPPCIDAATVAMAIDGSGPGAELAILMHDVGAHLVPEGDTVIPVDDHEGFLDHMAAMHARFWGWHDDLGVQSMPQGRSLPSSRSTTCPYRSGWPMRAGGGCPISRPTWLGSCCRSTTMPRP